MARRRAYYAIVRLRFTESNKPQMMWASTKLQDLAAGNTWGWDLNMDTGVVDFQMNVRSGKAMAAVFSWLFDNFDGKIEVIN
jgi:hypothetical protein